MAEFDFEGFTDEQKAQVEAQFSDYEETIASLEPSEEVDVAKDAPPELKELIEKQAGEVVDLPDRPDGATRAHVLQESHINAVNAALATGRALLVQGEPGIGKTQLDARSGSVARAEGLFRVRDSKVTEDPVP